jgi:hypothetical protein
LKNDFDPLGEEDFCRIKPQQRILIQELSLSDSEILHFLPSRQMQGDFFNSIGQKRTSRQVRVMSASHPITDIGLWKGFITQEGRGSVVATR